MVRRPNLDPIPEPPGIDPATATEFQTLAAADLPGIEAAADQAGLDLAYTAEALTGAERAMDELGLDLAAGVEELEAMQTEAAVDTLLPQLQAATDQDLALQGASNEAAEAGGELPAEASAEPASQMKFTFTLSKTLVWRL